MFEEYGVNLLENSEKIAKILKENNFTLKGLSREYAIRWVTPIFLKLIYVYLSA